MRSMKCKIIATHNPQDFFQGNEPEELTIQNEIEISDVDLQKMLNGGYVVVLALLDNTNERII